MRRTDGSAVPRTYQRPMSRTWWLRNRRYSLFILRESSSVFLALFVVLYLVQIAFLAAGPEPYERYLTLLDNPLMIALSVLILVFAVIHTLTWLTLTPAVTPLRAGNREAPRWAMVLGGVVAWAATSVVVGFVILAA